MHFDLSQYMDGVLVNGSDFSIIYIMIYKTGPYDKGLVINYGEGGATK